MSEIPWQDKQAQEQGKPMFDKLWHDNPPEDHAALLELFRTAWPGGADHRYGVALEVGAWAGDTTRLLLKEFSEVHVVDHWQGNPGDRLGEIASQMGTRHIFKTFMKNMADEVNRRLHVHYGSSLMWSSVWVNKPLDFVYIDGNHEYSYVEADIRAWWQHLRPGGLMVCHDYGVFTGVTQAVEKHLPGFKTAGRTLAWAKKPMGCPQPLPST